MIEGIQDTVALVIAHSGDNKGPKYGVHFWSNVWGLSFYHLKFVAFPLLLLLLFYNAYYVHFLRTYCYYLRFKKTGGSV